MDRAQFMQQLERLLVDISEDERQEALDYYESYFDDAGEDQESDVIRELGSPGKVAAIIKADLKESNDRYAEYTELGYEDTRTREPGQMPDKYTALARTGRSAGSGRKESDKSTGRNQTYEGAGNNSGTERKFGRDRARGRFEQAFSRAGEQMDQAFNRAGEQFDQALNQAGEQFDQARSRAGEQFSKAGEQMNEAFSRAGEQFDQACGRAEEQFNRARSRAEERRERADRRAGNRYERANSRAERGYHADNRKNHTGVILLLILLVFASPFIAGAAGGILGVVITILFLPFLLIFAFGAAAVGVIAGAVGTVAGGIGICFSNPAGGILTIGVGCLLMALGIIIGVFTVWLAGRIIPRLVRKFTDLCQRILNRRKDGAGL